MVGSALKKLAQQYGMRVDQGVAYGSMGGFCATMSEGNGYKQIIFATAIADAAKNVALQHKLMDSQLRKGYRLMDVKYSDKFIQVIFRDNPGTMKKIQAFLAFFLPLLEEAGATKANICPECGCEVTSGVWKLIGGTAYYMHQACADKVCRDIVAAEENRKEEDRGNYVTGFLGALLGSAVGSILWAVVLYFGYVASIVGFVIGFLAEKGYNLLKGKQGKGKIAILIIAVILGVLVGNFGADVIALVQMINAGEMGDMTYGQIPLLILLVLLEDPSYLTATLSNIGLGLLFSGLGVWSLLRRTKAEVSGVKIVDLK